MEKTKVDPQSAIFVDDRIENVIAAECLGMQGIVFNTSENLRTLPENKFGVQVDVGKSTLIGILEKKFL